MLWHLRRPSDEHLRDLLVSARSDELRYEPVGRSLGGATPHGLTRHRWTGMLPGPDPFDRAVAVLGSWGVQRGSGLAVVADGDVAVGVNVALAAPLPVGFVTATCRVVAVVDEPDRYGFAYGTLGHHPERGEESFVVRRGAGGTVTFEIVAVSRPHQWIARAVPFLADRLQAAATHRYLDALRDAVADGTADVRRS